MERVALIQAVSKWHIKDFAAIVSIPQLQRTLLVLDNRKLRSGMLNKKRLAHATKEPAGFEHNCSGT